MVKIVATLCALSFASTVALAQQASPPPPPSGPTAAQCQEGWKQGSRWTQEQFTTACQKIKEGQKN